MALALKCVYAQCNLPALAGKSLNLKFCQSFNDSDIIFIGTFGKAMHCHMIKNPISKTTTYTTSF